MSPLSLPPTVDLALDQAAERYGDLEAYVEPASSTAPRRAMTFAEWHRRAEAVAGWLSRHRVGRGDVVALLLPSSIDYAVVYAASVRLGAVTSGLNPRLGRHELASICTRLQPAVTVAGEAEAAGRDDLALGHRLRRAELAEAVEGPPPKRRPVLSPDEVVAVVWTSGTTGSPKGAVFDHANLAAVAQGTDVLSQPGDRRLSPLPFAHVGYMTRAFDEIAHGVTTVLTPTPWQAASALEILATEAITVAQGVPAQWRLLLDLPRFDEVDLSGLRVAGTGAARVEESLVEELRRRLEVPVVVRYTSTESSLGTGTRPGDPDEVVATTVGRPVPGVELRLVDEAGRSVPTGAVGRVWLRSGAVMRGYWGRRPPGPAPVGLRAAEVIDRPSTSEVLGDDGWLRTGDSGYLGEDGNLRLVGRQSEMYIRGGYNVYPAEIEAVLNDHPMVAQAVVLGAFDPVLGEVGVAFVVPEGEEGPTLTQLREACRARLADYKAPDALVVVDSVPLTAMMKVDRRALSDRAARAAAERTVALRGERDGAEGAGARHAVGSERGRGS